MTVVVLTHVHVVSCTHQLSCDWAVDRLFAVTVVVHVHVTVVISHVHVVVVHIHVFTCTQ